MTGNARDMSAISLRRFEQDKVWLVTAFNDERGQVARQARISDVPPASASTRLPDATGQIKNSTARDPTQDALDARLANAPAVSAAREEILGVGDFELELPDGTTVKASEMLDDAEADGVLVDVLDACKTGGGG